MKMIKRITAVFWAVVMGLMLCACGEEQTAQSSTQENFSKEVSVSQKSDTEARKQESNKQNTSTQTSEKSGVPSKKDTSQKAKSSKTSSEKSNSKAKTSSEADTDSEIILPEEACRNVLDYMNPDRKAGSFAVAAELMKVHQDNEILSFYRVELKTRQEDDDVKTENFYVFSDGSYLIENKKFKEMYKDCKKESTALAERVGLFNDQTSEEACNLVLDYMDTDRQSKISVSAVDYLTVYTEEYTQNFFKIDVIRDNNNQQHAYYYVSDMSEVLDSKTFDSTYGHSEIIAAVSSFEKKSDEDDRETE